MNYGKWLAIPSVALLVGGICAPLLHAADERQIDPTFRVSDFRRRFPFRRPEDIARWEEGLRKAGLPE